MKILLISGHGGGDPGAVAKIKDVLYKEAEETIKVVNDLKCFLEEYATVDVYSTERNAFKDLKSGELKKDFTDYDLVVEIHFNSCVKDLVGDNKTTGTEVYIPYGGNTEVAQTIVDKIALIGLRNRGVKTYNYSVIATAHKAGATAVLVEVCFIDDADDMKIYLSNDSKVAENIAEGIIEAYKLERKRTVSEAKKLKIMVNGRTKEVEAVNIDGYNYIKARDIGKALGFDVGYDEKMKMATFEN